MTPETDRPREREAVEAEVVIENPAAGLESVLAEHSQGAPLPGWKVRFIQSIAVLPNVRAACEVAGVSRATAYRHQASDPEFAAAWATAIEEGVDRLEQEALERATVGFQRVHETYRADGTLASRRTERIVSDRLMELLLKAHRPEKYVERLRVGEMAPENEIDAEIMGLARELQQIATSARNAALEPGTVVEVEVQTEGSDQ